MLANPRDRVLAIVEGELEALAVVLMARAGLNVLDDVAEVRAVNGTSGFQPDQAADSHGRTVLLPYGAGRDEMTKAAGLAYESAARLCSLGHTAEVWIRPPGDEEGGPARDLAGLVHERTARFETPEPDAAVDMGLVERLAWRAVLNLPVYSRPSRHTRRRGATPVRNPITGLSMSC